MTFMPSMVNASAAAGANLVAGLSGNSTGYTEAVFGSYSPRELFGELVRTLITTDATPDSVTFETEDPNVVETFWERITITGVFVGGQKTLVWDRVADAFFYQANIGSRTRWQSTAAINADGSELMINGNSYQVSIINTIPAAPGTPLSLIAGDSVPFRGYDVDIPIGALTPKEFNSRVLGFIRNDNATPDFLIGFEITEGVVANTDAAFIQMTLDGDFSLGSVQQIYVRSAGAYLAGPPSIWTFPPDTPMINGRTYIATFT